MTDALEVALDVDHVMSGPALFAPAATPARSASSTPRISSADQCITSIPLQALGLVYRQSHMERKRTVTWQDPARVGKASLSLAGAAFLRAIADRTLPPPPIAELMGFDIEEVGEGRVVFGVEPQEYHYNPIGMVHGGLAATLLDSAMGCAVHSLLPEGRAYTTLELKVNFVRPLKHDIGRVRAIGKVIHMGGKVATAEGSVVDAAGKLYAHATATCLLMNVSAPVV